MESQPQFETYAKIVSDDRPCGERFDCPAAHRVSSLPGGRVVQGTKIPEAVRQHMIENGMPVHEDAVWIPDELEV